MSVDDTPEEAAFRAEVRSWLDGQASRRSGHAGALLEFLEDNDSQEEAQWVAGCRSWQHSKSQAGYGAISWPKECGGKDSPIQQVIFEQEESQYDVATGAFDISLGMIAPTLLSHGTDEQKAHVERMLDGSEIWCQLFSEPSAGTDLASIRTRAQLAGDEWIISGQKVWTSGAHYADWGYIVARSDTEVPKHNGLTAFILPMDSPGITVRPLRQMSGGSNFNEVFFDEVRVPDAHRVGAPGEGWRVAVTTLMNERYSSRSFPGGRRMFDTLLSHAQAHGTISDSRVRDKFADVYSKLRVNQFMNDRILTAVSRGEEPGPEGSCAKLAIVDAGVALSELTVMVVGDEMLLDNEWSRLMLGVPGMRIGGGTDEAMRTIIGERILGLPAEPRVDRDVAFSALRT